MAALAQAGQICVKFHGERDSAGPLTLGQRNTWQWIGNKDFGLYSADQWVFDVPDRTTLDDVAEAFGVLMARHESLRTTYPVQGGELVQRVTGSGQLSIDVFEVAHDEPASDPASGELDVVAQELTVRLRERPFDLASQLPLRVAVAVGRRGVRAVVAVCSHMAADFGAMAVIGQQFAELVADPAARWAGPRSHQPLDQAAFERSDRGRRQAEAALRYWQDGLSRRSQCLYAVPSVAEDLGPRAAILSSPAAAMAFPHVARRTGASAPTVTLAAVCAVLARRTGYRRCVLSSLSSNRFARHLRGYVGTLAQDGLVSVDTRADGFDELVRRAANATLKANRHSLFDAVRLHEAATGIEYQRGILFLRDCVFNDLSAHHMNPRTQALYSIDVVDQTDYPSAGSAADAAAALPRTRVSWYEQETIPALLVFQLITSVTAMMLRITTGDTGCVPPAEMEALLRAVERLIVAAAAGDVDLARLGEITGVEPVVRDAGWLYVDSCWVELSEVRRLVRDALPGRAPGVFAVPGQDGQPVLVAYLASGDGARTAEQAHAACMAVLAGRHTTMTPGRYVICDRAPGDPADLAGWQDQRILTDGDGRRR